MKHDVDIAIVGSGPGGAITAWELLKNKKNVVLIESGSLYNLNSCAPYSTAEMQQKYKNGGLTPTFNSPRITYVEGECVGGGSEINSGFYHRTPEDIIKRWGKEFSIKNFSNEDLIEYYKQIEKEISVSKLPQWEDPADASLKLKIGADKLGWANMEVPRWFKFRKDKDGIKQSMTETYIKKYIKKGGDLITNLKVMRLKKRKTRWVLLCKNTNSGELSHVECNFVFLCGGSINTPFLLRNSGIKRNIGNTLQMHPTIKVTAEFDEIINHKSMGVPVHQVKEFSPEISIGCSISSKPYLALAMLDNKKYDYKVDENWQKMAIYYAMIKPGGNGKVRKIPFFNDPLVTYALQKNDLKLLSSGLKKMSKILLHAGAKNIFPSIKNYGPIKKLSDLESIPDILPSKNLNLMTIHLFSSCPMGENENICATNSYGKINGFNNLYINDGSLIPTAPGVNPQGTIMVIAKRNVKNFLEKN